MADLNKTDRLLQSIIDSAATFAKIFNNASKDVTKGVEYLGKPVDELRNKINELNEEAQSVREIAIKINSRSDPKDIESYIERVKELDRLFDKLSTDINGGITAMNKAFAYEITGEDAGSYTGVETTKQKLNEVVSNFSYIPTDMLSDIAPKLKEFVDSYATEVNRLEYEMGRLTEYSRERSDTDKAIGFTVEQKDIIDVINEKNRDLAEYDEIVKSWDLSGIDDERLKDVDADVYNTISGIKAYITKLNNAVGTFVTGYIGLFDRANGLLKEGEAKSKIVGIASSDYLVQEYNEAAGRTINWDEITTGELSRLSDKVAAKYADVLDDQGSKAKETVSDIEDTQDKAKETSNSINDLGNRLNEAIKNATALSDDEKSNILDKEYLNKLKWYKDKLDTIGTDISYIGGLNINYLPEAKLDAGSQNDAAKLVEYKASISKASEDMYTIGKQAKELFESLKDVEKAIKLPGSGIDTDKLKDIKSILESGYRVNLIDGSAAAEDIELVKKEFTGLIEQFRNSKIQIESYDNLETLAKIDTINSRNKEKQDYAERAAAAQASYNDNVKEYIKLREDAMQADSNVVALLKVEKDLLNDIEDKEEKTKVVERYDKYIANEKKAAASARGKALVISKEFERYKLETPVVADVQVEPKLSGDFAAEYAEYARKETEKANALIAKQALSEAKTYVSDQEALTGKKMPYDEQLRYYDEQLKKVSADTREYIEILKLKRSAEEKAADEAEKNAAREKKASEDAIKKLLEETKSYVSDQEALTGKKMPYAEQIRYYKEQLKKLPEGTREYIEALKMQRSAENAAVKEGKTRRDSILSTIQSITSAINSAVNKVISIIRSGISIINKVFSTAGKIVTRVVVGVRRIIQVFGSLSNRVKQSLGIANNSIYGGNKALNLLKGTATELDSKLNLLSRAYNALFNNQLVNDAKELQASVYSLQNIVGTEQTQEVIDWANAMEYAFGLSARQLISDINELTGVVYGLGIKAQYVGVASENILMISRYLAFMGAAGSDTDAVMEKLLSGLKGMTQSIDDLGISVREAQMDAFLKKLKAQGGEYADIETSFANLNEEARIYVRYASIIDQVTSKYDLENFANALTTVTGSLSLLKETVRTLRLTVGTGLNNIIAKLSTYIIPILSYVNDLIVRVFSHFDIDTNLSTDMNKGAAALSNVSGMADDAKDSLDAVSEASKEAGGNLQSFDRINNVTTSSGSGSGSDGFDYSKLFTSGIDKINKLAFDAQESYMERLKRKLKEDVDSLSKYIKSKLNEITGREINLGFDMATISGNLKSIFNHIKDTLKTWGTFVISIGVKIADDMNLGLIITKLSTLIERFTALARTVSNVVTPILNSFYETTLRPLVEELGVNAVNLIDKWILKTNETETNVMSADWAESFSNTLDSAFSKVEQFLGVLTRTKAEAVLDETAGTSWGLFLSVLDAFLKVGEALAPIIADLAAEFGAFLRDEALPWFIEKLEDLSIWLTENKDKIEEFLSTFGGIAWEAFKLFVEAVAKLIDLCVQHPKAVAAFFIALTAIKLTSWATDSAVSLIKLFNIIKDFKNNFGGNGTAEAVSEVLGLPGATAAAGTAGKGILGTLKAAGKWGLSKLGKVLPGAALVAAGTAGLTYDYNNISDYSKVDKKQKELEKAGLKAIEEGNYALAQEYSKKIDIMEEIQNNIFKRPKDALDEDYVDELYQQWLEEQDLLAEQEQTRKENSEKLIEYNNAVTNSAKDTSTSVVNAYSTVPDGVNKSFSTAAEGAKNELNSIPGDIHSDAVVAQYSSLPEGVENIFAGAKIAANNQTNEITSNAATGCKAMTNAFLAYNTAVRTIISNTNANINKNFDSISKRADEILKKYANLGTLGTGTSYQSRFSGLTYRSSTFVPKYETSSVTGNTTLTVSEAVGAVNNALEKAAKDTTDKTYAIRSKNVIGTNALGGSIAGGQLFIANEGGNAELIGNIDGTRKTNVANNNMIMEAMSSGVYEAVYNALAEVFNQRGFNNNTGSANIKIDGFGLIDQSTLRELARLLAPYLSSNSINIADTGFSI